MLSVQANDLSLQIPKSSTDYADSEKHRVEIHDSHAWDSYTNTHENSSLNSKAPVSHKS